MNPSQTVAVNLLIATIQALRGITASVSSFRSVGSRVYFQLTGAFPYPFPELSVSSKGGLWSDNLCKGGEVKSFPVSSVLPYHYSLAFSDLRIAGKAKGYQDAFSAYKNASTGASAPAPVAEGAPTTESQYAALSKALGKTA